MSKSFIELVKENKLSALSAFGSFSSIVALGVVVIGTLATDNIPPVLMGWRIIFFFTTLMATAGGLLFTYHWAREGYQSNNGKEHSKIISVILRTIAGLFITGIALDGLFASIYWTPWLYGARLFLEYIGWLS